MSQNPGNNPSGKTPTHASSDTDTASHSRTSTPLGGTKRGKQTLRGKPRTSGTSELTRVTHSQTNTRPSQNTGGESDDDGEEHDNNKNGGGSNVAFPRCWMEIGTKDGVDWYYCRFPGCDANRKAVEERQQPKRGSDGWKAVRDNHTAIKLHLSKHGITATSKCTEDRMVPIYKGGRFERKEKVPEPVQPAAPISTLKRKKVVLDDKQRVGKVCVVDEGFGNHLKTLQQCNRAQLAQILTATPTTLELFTEIEEDLKKTLKAEFLEIDTVAISLACCESNYGCFYLSISVHWIDDTWLGRRSVVGFEYLSEKNDLAKSMLECFTRVISEFGLHKKIRSITTDDGEAFTMMLDQFSEHCGNDSDHWRPFDVAHHHVPCFISWLHSWVEEGLKSLQIQVQKPKGCMVDFRFELRLHVQNDLSEQVQLTTTQNLSMRAVQKLRNIAGAIINDRQIMNTFRALATSQPSEASPVAGSSTSPSTVQASTSAQPQNVPINPVLDDSSNWVSTLTLLEWANKYKDALKSLVTEQSWTLDRMLNDADFDNLEQIREFLLVFYEVISQWEDNHHLTIPEGILGLSELASKLDSYMDATYGWAAVENIITKLKEFIAFVGKNTTCATSKVLDPRLTTNVLEIDGMTRDEQVELNITMSKLAVQLWLDEYAPKNLDPTTIDHGMSVLKVVSGSTKDAFHAYVSAAPMSMYESENFWKTCPWPDVAKMAREFSNVPATSITINQYRNSFAVLYPKSIVMDHATIRKYMLTCLL